MVSPPYTSHCSVDVTLDLGQHADKIQRKAALVGFDHPEMHQIYGKVEEELAEVKEEADLVPINHSALEMEVGDLLFVAAAVGRRLNIDPERALHRARLHLSHRPRGHHVVHPCPGWQAIARPGHRAVWPSRR